MSEGWESLEGAILRAGSPVALLREAPAAPYTFPVTPEFSNWRDEQRAWREGCALLDQSHHMTDLYVEGPDAVELLSSLGVNSFEGFAPDKAKQFVACNPDGYVIGDAILYCLGEGSFDLVGHPMALDWVQYHAERGDYDVEVERDENSLLRQGPPRVYRYEVQGPLAPEVLREAVGGELPEVRFFGVAEVTISGCRVRALRHGMAGQPGFELSGPWEEGERVLEVLVRAGEKFGLRRAGSLAYSAANLESAWVPAPCPAIYTGEQMKPYREWLPARRAGSLGGSFYSERIEDYYLTPYELGYGRFVKFDHDFVGREALEEMAEGPHRRKVTLVWEGEDVKEVFASLFEREGLPAKYINLPKARYALFHYDRVVKDGRTVGVSTDCGYSHNERSMLSLAVVDEEVAEPGSEVVLLWGEEPNSSKPTVEEHRQVEIKATVQPAPLVEFARTAYRSS
ncbi:glycine cleavage system protein T [Rubrobacter xylanophilus]|uniref:Glycine cleavage system protein T n=1 Tax=Rubrobacter xylanophilus TaxID=49319 RepID=A0A510HJS5_9ACTN|nr:aminomethyl transferase family protein [Rubrobacter xylanophilus]BBL80266.1 glycine cleavage system protein T [Rubrobacter xylanophilus]